MKLNQTNNWVLIDTRKNDELETRDQYLYSSVIEVSDWIENSVCLDSYCIFSYEGPVIRIKMKIIILRFEKPRLTIVHEAWCWNILRH
jgi:hypothetical protein